MRLLIPVLLPFALAAADPVALVAPGAVVERLGDGYRFTEGPAVQADGSVLFTDIPANRILRWTATAPIAI